MGEDARRHERGPLARALRTTLIDLIALSIGASQSAAELAGTRGLRRRSIAADNRAAIYIAALNFK